MNPDTLALVEYRLEQAHDTLEAGRALVTGGHLRDAVNRGYYAMFYAGLALLASRMHGVFVPLRNLRPRVGCALP